MKATINSDVVENGRNYGEEKETIRTYNAVTCKGGKFAEPVTVRIYMGRSSKASKVYATIWSHTTGKSHDGTGSAGGCGYHKPSAAVAEAIDNAGIKLNEDIAGRGDSAIEEAILAICEMYGYAKDEVYIVRN